MVGYTPQTSLVRIEKLVKKPWAPSHHLLHVLLSFKIDNEHVEANILDQERFGYLPNFQYSGLDDLLVNSPLSTQFTNYTESPFLLSSSSRSLLTKISLSSSFVRFSCCQRSSNYSIALCNMIRDQSPIQDKEKLPSPHLYQVGEGEKTVVCLINVTNFIHVISVAYLHYKCYLSLVLLYLHYVVF